jgi:hypothetical protein
MGFAQTSLRGLRLSRRGGLIFFKEDFFMFNKKFFVVMAVLLSVSLFLIGCPTEAEDGAAGAPGNAGDPGTPGTDAAYAVPASIGAVGLQGLIDAYGSTRGLSVGITEIVGGGMVTFGAAKVEVLTSLKTDADASGGPVALYLVGAANVTLKQGAKIVLGNANDMALVDADSELAIEGGKVASHAPLGDDGKPDFSTVDGNVTAVEDYTLTATAADIPSGLTVYVYGALTIDEDSVNPAGTVVAIGTVTVSGDSTGSSNVFTKVNVDAATISASGDDAKVKFGTTLAGTKFDLAVGLDVGGVTDVTADVTGAGVLTLSGAVTAAAITGDGKVTFSNSAPIAFGAGSSVKAAAITFVKGFTSPGAEGTVTLDGAVTVTNAETVGFGHADGTVTLKAGTVVSNTLAPATAELTAGGDDVVLTGASTSTVVKVLTSGGLDVSGAGIEFDGPVAFGGNLTLTAVPATFNGNVSFVEGKKITLTTAASIITLGQNIVLGLPTAANVPAVFGSVIDSYGAEEAGVTLTPADGTVLTFTAPRTITQSGSGGHGIKIAGKAGLPAGATYKVASESDKVGSLTLDTGAELLLASGVLLPGPNELDTAAESKLVLTGATDSNGALLKGDGTLKAGAAAIVGGDNGWQAVGTGAVTIAADKIEAAAVLTSGATGTVDPSITVGNGSLTVAASTVIDFTTVASLVVEKSASPVIAGTVILAADTTILKFGTGAETGDATSTQLASAFTNLTSVGSGITGKTTDSSSSSGTLTQIIGANDNNTLVGGDNDDVTINSTVTVDNS